MNSQDQYNEKGQINQSSDETEFSTRRRVSTAILVLVAALLLGYVIYSYVLQLSPQPVSNQEAEPTQPELTTEEQAILRLQALQQEPVEPPTDVQLQQLLSVQQENVVPTQEQLMRLEALGDGS
jgi:flagellar basal body-associated protein FliL